MIADKKTFYKNVADYYLYGEVSYRDVWDLDNSLSIHYAYSHGKTLKLKRDLPLLNQQLALFAAITPQTTVLDAGCGIGGSCFFLAKKYQCSTHGISVSPYQINKATLLSKTLSLETHTQFSVQNFENTTFAPNTFDVVWAVESVCYAPEKMDFLREAYRVLKPGGKLAIADGFRAHQQALLPRHQKVLTDWFKGWAMQDIDHLDTFLKKAEAVGFSLPKTQNISKHICPASRRLYYLGIAANTLKRIYNFVGKKYGNPHTTGNAIGAVNQYKALKNNWWQYYFVVLEKE